MIMVDGIFKKTPLDFVGELENLIYERINEYDIDVNNLKSFYAYKGYEDRIEIDYDEDEAFESKEEAFIEDINDLNFEKAFGCRNEKLEKLSEKAKKRIADYITSLL